ncbi:hypothetical protein MHPYR_320065 [uncultured Mycobacterium sp.]|uniref:Uncharacterized protein n=1 Tax=uncultured Mycobacterium sp. TaxID=171292 RepID=A0A1Y5PG15_9MYCO|nr:hypothetical protein MHPYR_300014 [uncultured Mycobacterium sp.]SBS76487.1 hypothetical protein MHPYR_320065 [uncultured Mycobacterium sp.]
MRRHPCRGAHGARESWRCWSSQRKAMFARMIGLQTSRHLSPRLSTCPGRPPRRSRGWLHSRGPPAAASGCARRPAGRMRSGRPPVAPRSAPTRRCSGLPRAGRFGERIEQTCTEDWVDLLLADRADGMYGDPKLLEIACATVALLEVLLEPGSRGGIHRSV